MHNDYAKVVVVLQCSMFYLLKMVSDPPFANQTYRKDPPPNLCKKAFQ